MTGTQTSWPAPPWYVRASVLDTVIFATGLVASVAIVTMGILRPENLAGYVAFVLLVLGQLLARLAPLWGLTLVVVGAAAAALLAVDYVGPWTLVVFTVFCVTVRIGRPIPVGVAAAVIVYIGILLRLRDADPLDAEALIALSMILGAAAGGAAVRAHGRYWGELQQHAHEAVGRRTAEVDRRIADERVSIAQDLHDAVGHEIAVVSMSLGLAEAKLATDESATRDALSAARTSVKQVLREMQEIMLVLHRGDSVTSSEPLASYERLPGLVAQFEAGGGTVDASIDPAPPDLPYRVGVTIYRLVQEALTNSQRHGSGVVAMAVSVTDRDVFVEVSNPKSLFRGRSIGTGHGLVGMKERARAAGGDVTIVDTENRFTLRARVPIDLN